MDGHPESNMAFEHGKPVSVELTDGTSLRGFVHAEDKAAGLVCLELIPSSDVTLLSTCNVKSVATISDLSESRKWPANRSFSRFVFLPQTWHQAKFCERACPVLNERFVVVENRFVLTLPIFLCVLRSSRKSLK